ncbi:hypothetical protein BTA51_13920 [Hahella sp. CCB-MM4]|uniref:hypothetical protein n=1 Tax=Hahella sp. (strain CCB-MM4) TaxID=1926491 RepID=UPI000B9A8851|nr:hypothetical protein [Hahella sp. CCB-MM4]OZG72622.1 hypothetical protein BTA51_13920 [Hahella sp. CCB-MM4]
MNFPPRTRASDAIIRNLHAQLTAAGVASGGANRCMITVVVTGDVDVPRRAIISTSGPRVVQGALRTAINNLAGHGIYGGVAYTIVHFSGANGVVNPLNSGMATQDHYHVQGGRHCAEPKALEAASGFGDRMTGMSTIWWGNNANPYPDPSNNPAGIFALPCEVCQTNEVWFMKRVEERRMVSKGAARRAFDI